MDKQELIAGLNRDLANEFQAILAYTQWAARVTGPHRPQFRGVFQTEIPDELRHAQFLADTIVAMGGMPTTEPTAVPETGSAREMLQATLEAERQAIKDYIERANQADALGEVGLKVELENMVADETRHAQEVTMLLDGWSER
jgi:bacterioferritin